MINLDFPKWLFVILNTPTAKAVSGKDEDILITYGFLLPPLLNITFQPLLLNE